MSPRTHPRLLFVQNSPWAVLASEVKGPFRLRSTRLAGCRAIPGCCAERRVSGVPLLQERFREGDGLSHSAHQASGPWMALGSKDSCFAGWWAVSGELAGLALQAPMTVSLGKSQTPGPSRWWWPFGARGEVLGSSWGGGESSKASLPPFSHQVLSFSRRSPRAIRLGPLAWWVWGPEWDWWWGPFAW